MHTINLYHHIFPEGCPTAIDALNQTENEILHIHHLTRVLHKSMTHLTRAGLFTTVLELPSPYNSHASNEACHKEWVYDYYGILTQTLGLQDVAIPEGGLQLNFEEGYCLIERLEGLLTITALINQED